jgi:hypothetical protein
MNWTKIARCTAVAIGTTFVVAAGAYLVIHIFLLAALGRFSNSPRADPMETEILASTILGAFEKARSQLIGRSVILTDGKARLYCVASIWWTGKRSSSAQAGRTLFFTRPRSQP